VLVSGRHSRPLPGGRFAVWLVFYDQRWIIKHAGLDAKATTPPRSLGVPCDIRPAFAEPAC
jgi:hypothetical protein